jgi:succinyl-diaminopimelate desuccinylase
MNETSLGSVAQITRQIAREQRDAIVKLCANLVEAQSVNPPGDTRKVANVVHAALTDLGIKAEFASSLDSMPSVIARIENGGRHPHLVLNVHMDTMPAGDERAWNVDPYTLTEQDGRLYGLGIGNMKGSVAAMIYALAILNNYREFWQGRITFTAVSDEVVFGPNGAQYLLDHFPDLVGDGLICGEGPGFKRLAIAEKGVLWLAIEATGTPGHSSSVSAMSSATAKLAAMVTEIDTLNGSLATPPTDLAPYFPSNDSGFELSANVGTIQSGTFIGQVATSGLAEVDFRVPPGMTIDEVENLVVDFARQLHGVSVRRIKGWNPNWTSPTSALCQAWRESEHALSESTSEFAIRLPASDASRWRAKGVPALCYGPQPGLSAGIDDYIEESEVLRCVEFFATASINFLRVSQNQTDRVVR